jgi:hypothetical protein
VEADDGRLYEPGIAQGLTFADIEWQVRSSPATTMMERSSACLDEAFDSSG